METRETQEYQVQREIEVLQERMVPQVQQGLLVHKVFQEHRDQQENLVSEVYKECLALREMMVAVV